MKNFLRCNSSVLLISALLLTSCQPPTAADQQPAIDDQGTVDSPIIVDADTITMAADYILSIKPSRYQPSLGLQGDIEPIKQVRLRTSQPIVIIKVAVVEGQQVKKGDPLLIVQRQVKQTNTSSNIAAKSMPRIDSATDINNTAKDIDNQKAEQKAPSTEQKLADDIDNNRSNKPLSDITTVANNATLVTTTQDSKEGVAKDPNNTTIQQPLSAEAPTQLITIRAPLDGRVTQLNAIAEQQITAGELLLNLGDDTHLHFIATLPIQAEPQLSIGQNVNFTTASLTDKFTGQVSKLLTSDKPDQLLVYVNVINNEASRGKLKANMTVTGRVDYGQIEVGTIVPKNAIHDADLSMLKKPPYRPIMVLTANVWIIQQDQRLTRQPVEVIEYNPSTDRYLIAGINNDSLICLAPLPLESAGKKVVIS